MDLLEKETKAIITAVLSSSKLKMTIKGLNSAFSEQAGYNIPYSKLGYQSLELYLYSLNDAVEIFGQGEHAEIRPISQKSAHVVDLVSKQRFPSTKQKSRYRFKTEGNFNLYRPHYQRSSAWGNQYGHPSPYSGPYKSEYWNPCYYSTHNRADKPERVNVNMTKSETVQQKFGTPEKLVTETSCKTSVCALSKSPTDTSYRLTGHNANTYFQPHRTDLNTPIQKHKSLESVKYSDIKSVSISNESCASPSCNYLQAGPGNVLLNSCNMDTGVINFGGTAKHNSSQSSDEYEVFYSDEEEINTNIPQVIQNNLRRLVAKHPDGIWCAKIPNLYKKEYGTDLEYSEFGYRSLSQMCMDLKNAFNCIQPDQGDLKLFDKSQPMNNDALKTINRIEYFKMKATVEEMRESALPETGVEDLLHTIHGLKVPPDVVEHGVFIERQWLDPKDKVFDYIDVNVAEVYDPSKFWLNLKCHGAELNKIMDNMQVFYDTNATTYEIPKFAMKVGLYISTVFLKEYHRAVIIDDALINTRNLVKVFFIDYGTVALMNTVGICYLHEQFAKLPAQAIRARLTGIYPPIQNEQWSRESSEQLVSLVLNKDLIAQIIDIDTKREALEVVLADVSDEQDFFINDALVYDGYALFTYQDQEKPKPKTFVPIVQYIHLFPTFDELENGSVPTASQMISIEYAGVGIDQIYPRYFKDVSLSPASLTSCSSENDKSTFDYDLAVTQYYKGTCDDDSENYEYNQQSTHIKEDLEKRWHSFLPGASGNSEKIPHATRKTKFEGNWVDLLDTKTRSTKFDVQSLPLITSNRLGNKAVAENVESHQFVNPVKEACIPKPETYDIVVDQQNLTLQHEIITQKYQQYSFQDDLKYSKNILVDTESQRNLQSSKPLILKPEAQILNPEKPQFIPNTQKSTSAHQPYIVSNVEHVETNVKQSEVSKFNADSVPVKRDVVKTVRPPPGFYNIDPVPLQQAHYQDSVNTYLAHTLNINPIMQPQIVLQPNVHLVGLCPSLPYLNQLTFEQLVYLQNLYLAQSQLFNPINYPLNLITNSSEHLNYNIPQHYLGSRDFLHENVNKKHKDLHSNPSLSDPQVYTNANSTLNKEVNVNSYDKPTDNTTAPSYRTVPTELNSKTEVLRNIVCDTACKEETKLVDTKKDSVLNNTCVEFQVTKSNQDSAVIEESVNTTMVIKNEINSHLLENNCQDISADSTQLGDGGVHITLSLPIETVIEEVDAKLATVNIGDRQECTDVQYALKHVSRQVLGNKAVHIIKHNEDMHFLLGEVTYSLLGKSLSVVQVRKMFIGTQYTVSVVDINLKKYPELKQDLLELRLINQNSTSVNVVPVTYVSQLVTVLTNDKSKLEDFEDFLKDSVKLLADFK